MSLLSSNSNNTDGSIKTLIFNGDLAQLIIALALMAVYLVELIQKLGSDQFIGGALVAVIGYYFGGKNSTTAATTSSASTLSAANSTPTPTTAS